MSGVWLADGWPIGLHKQIYGIIFERLSDRGLTVGASLVGNVFFRLQHVKPITLKPAVKSIGERQGVVSVALCTAPHLTKMVKSSMFATVFALNHLAILTHFDCRF